MIVIYFKIFEFHTRLTLTIPFPLYPPPLPSPSTLPLYPPPLPSPFTLPSTLPHTLSTKPPPYFLTS